MVRGTPVPEGLYHLVVHIWIRNRRGDFLIQKRSPLVDNWKNIWFMTGGSVKAGDGSRDTVRREAEEEMGLTLDMDGARFIFRVPRDGEYLTDVYLFERELDPATLCLQKEEVSEVRWASAEEIQHMMLAGDFAPLRYFPLFLEKIKVTKSKV